MSTPILRNGKIVAALTAGSKKQLAIDGPAVETLEILASHAGRALEHAQSFSRERRDRRRAAREAAIDLVSGLANRRRAQEVLATVRPGDALVLVDLDRFKDVNDRFGHSAGDALIGSVGEFLRRSVRGRDFCARYGGDEFLILLRSRVRDVPADVDSFTRRLWKKWHETSPLITLSGGGALVSLGEPILSALRRADEALYEAKRSGRDRFEICTRKTGYTEHEIHLPSDGAIALAD